MLKAEKLLQLRGCMLRTCNAARMPCQKRTCADTNSPVCQSLRQWQFKQRVPTKQPNLCKQRRTLAPPIDYCEYTLAELRGGQYMPAKYRRVRVTREQRTLLDRYAAHSRLGVGDPHVVDERQQPGLASYMRDVMEHNSFYNKLYCIDFYNNYDVDSGGRAGRTSPPNYLDPDELARLFELLRLGIELTPEQLAYLQQFLLQLALLDPAEMAAFLAMFEKMGLLTPNVLLLLQQLMQDLNIDPRRLQALNAVIGTALDKVLAAAAAAAAAAEAEANAKRLAEQGWANEGGAGVLGRARRAEKVYGADGFDASGFDRNGFDRNGFNKDGFDANGFDRNGFDRNGYDRNGLKRGEAEQQKKQLLATKAREKREQMIMPQKPEVRLARKKRVVCTGQCKGYYEPWDADLSWEEAQELVERAVAWRMMRLDLDKFNYTRGLEKYVAELERSKPKPTTTTTKK